MQFIQQDTVAKWLVIKADGKALKEVGEAGNGEDGEWYADIPVKYNGEYVIEAGEYKSKRLTDNIEVLLKPETPIEIRKLYPELMIDE